MGEPHLRMDTARMRSVGGSEARASVSNSRRFENTGCAADQHNWNRGEGAVVDGGDDAKGAAAAATQRPVQVGLGARVDDLALTVGGHHLVLQDVIQAEAIVASGPREPAAGEPPTTAADVGAASTDDRVAVVDRRLVRVAPRLAAAEVLCERVCCAARVHERPKFAEAPEVLQPDEQTAPRSRRAGVVVPRGLDADSDVVLVCKAHRRLHMLDGEGLD